MKRHSEYYADIERRNNLAEAMETGSTKKHSIISYPWSVRGISVPTVLQSMAFIWDIMLRLPSSRK